jgi:hypothetical protein
MGLPEDEPVSETQRLIAETLRVPLDKTVRDAFTPRQKALLAELDAMTAETGRDSGADTSPRGGSDPAG